MSIALGRIQRVVLCLVVALACASAQADEPKGVGVVDHQLVSQENWVKSWKADWASEKVVALLAQQGLEASVIGLDVLQDLERLKTYRAVMIPTDECYPDLGSKEGPISRNLLAYVQAGGIYILPMGASHCRWRNVETGQVAQATPAEQFDFMGLRWSCPGDHASPGPPMVVTPAGEKIGIPKPAFAQPVSSCARTAQPLGEIYVQNEAGQPSLVAITIGQGAMIHYTGGLPLGPDVRDWLIHSYAAVLKSGPDINAIRSVQWSKSRVHTLLPVAPRREPATGTPDAQAARQITLTGDGAWEIAQAPGDFSVDLADLESLEWTRVTLPGTIQKVLFEAGKIDNPWYSDNYKKLQWIHKQDWYLRRTIRLPDQWQGRHIRLRFDAMDYLGVVWLDTTFLGIHEGMAGGPTFDITSLLTPGSEHRLLVRLIHETGEQDLAFSFTRAQAIKSMAIDGTSYQWGNRFRSIGLWQPVRLIGTGRVYLEAPYVRTDRLGDRSADLWAEALITNQGTAATGAVRARIVDLETDQVVWQEETRQAVPEGVSYWERDVRLADPKLWWPNGLGSQSLYRLELTLLVDGQESDSITSRFGVRTLQLRRNPSWPDAPRSTPSLAGSSDPLDVELMRLADESYRFLFEVNGRPFYAKGACWLTSDDILALTPEREAWLVRAAERAGLNLFRLNGGCNLFETEQLYNLCDEAGILLWQELPLCWNKGHAAPRSAWRDQLTQTTLRLRQHPSLAVWVGGNEFQPYAEGVAPVLGLAREIFAAFDDRPFRMASPGGGTHHAYSPFDALYGGDPNWYVNLVHEGYNFVSEWSCPAFGNMSLLQRVVPADELARGPVGRDWEKFIQAHPAMRDRHSEVDFIGKYSFIRGSWYADLAGASVPDFVECSQMSQADLYGYVFEHWRAQFPYKGGQTVWLYNTISPVSSWNLIDWFGQPLMSYYSTKRAHEPVHVMAKTNFFSWGPGDTLRASVFALNDHPKAMEGAKITARLLDPDMKPVQSETWSLTLPASGFKSEAREVRWAIPPDTTEGYLCLELTLDGPDSRRLSQQVYWLRVVAWLADPEARKVWQAGPVAEKVCTSGPWLRPQIKTVPTTLEAKVIAATPSSDQEAELKIEVRNTGPLPAFPVRVLVAPDTYSVVWSDNYFWLAPGECVILDGTVRLDMRGLDPLAHPPVATLSDLCLEVSAWNAPPCNLSLGQAVEPQEVNPDCLVP